MLKYKATANQVEHNIRPMKKSKKLPSCRYITHGTLCGKILGYEPTKTDKNCTFVTLLTRVLLHRGVPSMTSRHCFVDVVRRQSMFWRNPGTEGGGGLPVAAKGLMECRLSAGKPFPQKPRKEVSKTLNWVWVYWCFTSHATIVQSYMWRHRCAGGLKKKLYLRSGSQRHVYVYLSVHFQRCFMIFD